MRPEKALEILKRLKIAAATSNVDGDRIFEPLSMGIEALEKQIPLRVIEAGGDGRACPACKSHFHWNYCSSCGQRVKH